MAYEGPIVCDVCGKPFKFLRTIRIVALPESTRIILQGQCHNEKAHECIPHLVRISTRVENLLSHNKEADGWNQIAEAATLREYEYYKEVAEGLHCEATHPCPEGGCDECCSKVKVNEPFHVSPGFKIQAPVVSIETKQIRRGWYRCPLASS